MDEEQRQIDLGDKSIYAEQGNVIVNYGDKRIPKNLTRPPFISGEFIGRDSDLEEVHQQLFEGKLLLLVNGEGGIGKTTLAAHYYNQYGQDYRHLAWVYAEGSLLDALVSLELPLQIEFPQDWSARRRLDSLLASAADLNEPCLLVIDNANDLLDLENYYQALRCCSNFHILMTTRITEFEQAATYKIKPLLDEDAFTLFTKHYPGHLEHENSLLKRILDAVGSNTLVIELLAKSLNIRNRLKTHYSLTDLANDLQQKGLLGIDSKAVSSAYHADGMALRKETPEAIIAAMYDLEELSDTERVLLSIFAVLPAENINFSELEVLLSYEEKLDDRLINLTQKGWLDYESNKDFKISPVVQEIARQKNKLRLLQDCRNLISGLIEKLEIDGGTGHFLNATYEQAALYARYGDTVLSHFSVVDEGLVILYEKLGSTHTSLGNLDRALEYFEERSRIGQELYEANPNNVSFKNGLAISYEKLGSTHTSLGNLDRALEYFEDEIVLFQELYEANPNNVSFKNGLAISSIQLGLVFEKLEKKEKCKEKYIKAKKLLEQLSTNFPDYVEFKNNLNWVDNQLNNM